MGVQKKMGQELPGTEVNMRRCCNHCWNTFFFVGQHSLLCKSKSTWPDHNQQKNNTKPIIFKKSFMGLRSTWSEKNNSTKEGNGFDTQTPHVKKQGTAWFCVFFHLWVFMDDRLLLYLLTCFPSAIPGGSHTHFFLWKFSVYQTIQRQSISTKTLRILSISPKVKIYLILVKNAWL